MDAKSNAAEVAEKSAATLQSHVNKLMESGCAQTVDMNMLMGLLQSLISSAPAVVTTDDDDMDALEAKASANMEAINQGTASGDSDTEDDADMLQNAVDACAQGPMDAEMEKQLADTFAAFESDVDDSIAASVAEAKPEYDSVQKDVDAMCGIVFDSMAGADEARRTLNS